MMAGRTQADVRRWRRARDAAVIAALNTWGAIAPSYEGNYAIEHTADGPRTEADRLADLLIVQRLKLHFPASEYGYLTEESEDDRRRLNMDRVWIIDPID